MADTGTGATLTLATTGSVGAIKSMTLPEFVIDKVETSHLGSTTFREYVGDDLSDPGEITAEILFNAETASVPSRGVAETVTVTWPIHDPTGTNTTNATLAGTGFITKYKLPDMQIGEVQMAEITIAFDGGTDPAFTAESA